MEQNIGTPAPFGQPVPSLEAVTPDMFEGVVAQGRPVVLRGAAKHWPLIEQARASARAAGDYLKRFDTGRPVQVWLGEPAIQGRFFYGRNARQPEFPEV
ncbi:MAG: cupin-like domain-containing protein [Asticcacaulis sp.]